MDKEKEICSKLKKIRKQKNLTLIDVAGKLGMNKSSLSRIENNKIALTLNMLHKICRALECTCTINIVYGDENISEPVKIEL